MHTGIADKLEGIEEGTLLSKQVFKQVFFSTNSVYYNF